MKEMEGIQVSVATRWHQLAVPLGFLLAGGSVAFIVFNRGPLLLAFAVALGLLVLPPVLAFVGFPTRNLVSVMPDGLIFSRRDPVAFADISSWGTDDFLKLVRPGQPTLLISAVDLPSRERLLREFETALQAWQQRQPAVTRHARRSYFYGSLRARAIGALIVVLGVGSSILALSTRDPSYRLAAVGGLGAMFGLAMMRGRRV
ncbi:hypothetical protein [Stenotrophomonas tumulicola]|uniref:Transmembrane protein n=1 Tax=Stenotrophomonas tumulicola TaxID=1685415 RepID=A0A7W3FJI3_9GAMM|nr:hypothetical protein [Stenotrophomonas tumulicola]MBA8680665.1 hypothetical protein [Stenotrophomonas tumulicola]